MTSAFHIPPKERGSVTVLALLLLVMLTLTGIGALTSSTSDIRTTQNETTYRQNFARAEAAVRSGSQALENQAPQTLLARSDVWVHSFNLPSTNLNDPTNWEDTSSASAIDSQCRYATIFEGLDNKASYDMTAVTQMYKFTVFGRSDVNDGEVIVEVGFKRRM